MKIEHSSADYFDAYKSEMGYDDEPGIPVQGSDIPVARPEDPSQKWMVGEVPFRRVASSGIVNIARGLPLHPLDYQLE